MSLWEKFITVSECTFDYAFYISNNSGIFSSQIHIVPLQINYIKFDISLDEKIKTYFGDIDIRVENIRKTNNVNPNFAHFVYKKVDIKTSLYIYLKHILCMGDILYIDTDVEIDEELYDIFDDVRKFGIFIYFGNNLHFNKMYIAPSDDYDYQLCRK